MQDEQKFVNPDWPVLRVYGPGRLDRIAMPLGGIGTGTVSLGGRGDLRHWEVMNRPARGFTPGRCFFMLCASAPDGASVTRVLEGPIPYEYYEGSHGATAPNHGLPRFRRASFHTAYPFAQVLLESPDVPMDVRLEAFNPLIPCDAAASGIPLAVLRFVVRNPGDRPVDAAVAGNIANFIGRDGTSGSPNRNRNERREADGLAGLFLRSDGVPTNAEQWGTMALALRTASDLDVTFRTSWYDRGWNVGLLDLWEDFASDGRLSETAPPFRPPDDAMVYGALAARRTIPPGAEARWTFLLSWHFPNRRTWTPHGPPPEDPQAPDPDRIGNWYAAVWEDAWHVLTDVIPRLPALETGTVRFVRAFCESDLPPVVKEAALFNLCNLRTQTCFRTADGRLFGWEGCSDRTGCCLGSCTHVWNYEQATAFLFGELARTMREVEFKFATDEKGLISFRVHLPLDRAREHGKAAADGQLGCLVKLYREWQLSGDDAFLREMWPYARRALEFCWHPGGWDCDQDGVMEGCQHNTMDVEYFGPNPQMQGWYLAALRAMEEMARYLGDADFADRCRQLFENGRQWTDTHLFNGEYYEHEVRPIPDPSAIAPGLRVGMGASNTKTPEFQLGAGCLVDQLVGQFAAHVCGLGYLLDPDHVRTTLRSIYRYNFRRSLEAHVNHMRSFALGREAGLVMASYPRGRRPRIPFPYFSEVMTGFEYTAAVGMLFEGMEGPGLRCMRAVRERYDGRKRNPFDEAECGHFYARTMASWAAVLAWTGFRYSAVTGTVRFAPREGRWFWSTGEAWGTCELRKCGAGMDMRLDVLGGTLRIRRIQVGAAALEFEASRELGAGAHGAWRLSEVEEPASGAAAGGRRTPRKRR